MSLPVFFFDKGLMKKTSVFLLMMAVSCCHIVRAEIIFRSPSSTQPAVETVPSSAVPALEYQTDGGSEQPVPVAPVREGRNIAVPPNVNAKELRQLRELAALAASGDIAANLQLGWLYYRGEKVKRSYVDAFFYFQEAANKGNIPGMLAAGYLMSFGYGVERNPNAARAYFVVAERAGFPRAAYLQSLLEESFNTAKARARARQLLERAASSGDPVAVNALANSYFRANNRTMARNWYVRALGLGSAAAGRNLERMEKFDQQRDLREFDMKKLSENSAHGDANASYELAVRYHRGIGVAVNFGQALRYYRLAARQGSTPAEQMLSMILSRSTPAVPINAAWMQELSRTMKTPPFLIGSENIGLVMELDDPLDGLFTSGALSSGN